MALCDLTRSYDEHGGGVRNYIHRKHRWLLDETLDRPCRARPRLLLRFPRLREERPEVIELVCVYTLP